MKVKKIPADWSPLRTFIHCLRQHVTLPDHPANHCYAYDICLINRQIVLVELSVVVGRGVQGVVLSKMKFLQGSNNGT